MKQAFLCLINWPEFFYKKEEAAQNPDSLDSHYHLVFI